ncbi:MAG: HD domain-containing protein, partial [Gemmatimonadales bacterium]
MNWTRERADALMREYTASESLRNHMYCVEQAMRAIARRAGEDEEAWGIVGLLHDYDYERFPNDAHHPGREHPAEGVRHLAGEGFP